MEKSPETHSEVCPQTLTLGLLAHTSECFHCVSRESERRKGRAAAETPLPQEVHTLVSKQERQEGPTHGMWGQTAPSWGCWADCPPKGFPTLSADWVKSPHAGTWTGPHREVEAPQSPVLTPSHLPLPCTGALTKGRAEVERKQGSEPRRPLPRPGPGC